MIFCHRTGHTLFLQDDYDFLCSDCEFGNNECINFNCTHKCVKIYEFNGKFFNNLKDCEEYEVQFNKLFPVNEKDYILECNHFIYRDGEFRIGDLYGRLYNRITKNFEFIKCSSESNLYDDLYREARIRYLIEKSCNLQS